MRQELVSDQELIKDYLSGNEESLRLLINRHQTQVFSSIMLLVKDKYLAEDIYQDTYIKVIKNLKKGKYTEKGKFLPWVLRIARNLVIDHFRKNQKMPTVTDSEGYDVMANLPFEADNMEDKMISEQSSEYIKRIIQELPDEQREVLILRHYAELSFKQIAEITDVSINTALGRMRYALNNLRKIIERKKVNL